MSYLYLFHSGAPKLDNKLSLFIRPLELNKQ